MDQSQTTAAEPLVTEPPAASAPKAGAPASGNTGGSSSGSSPAGTAKPSAAPSTKPPVGGAPAAALDEDIDFDDIEPVIPDIVIEEPAPPKPTSSSNYNNRQRGRR